MELDGLRASGEIWGVLPLWMLRVSCRSLLMPHCLFLKAVDGSGELLSSKIDIKLLLFVRLFFINAVIEASVWRRSLMGRCNCYESWKS
jgi:hypothetical protein